MTAMKRLIATAVLAAALASSALAQQQTAPPPNQPIVQEPPATLGQGVRQPSEPVLPPNPNTGVYDSKGNLIGADPDPRIREEIKRDPPPDKEGK
jgi:hypothetical protein